MPCYYGGRLTFRLTKWRDLIVKICQKYPEKSTGTWFDGLPVSKHMVKPKNKTVMTLVKLNQKPFEKTFNSLFEDFFQGFPSGYAGNDWNNNGFVPANIKETPEGYHLDIFAPGMDKQDFKVNMEKNILTISAEKKKESGQENEKMIRREYTYRSFSRSFTLDDTIDASRIAAKYENGVLLVHLPKKEEVKLMPKEITIQ